MEFDTKKYIKIYKNRKRKLISSYSINYNNDLSISHKIYRYDNTNYILLPVLVFPNDYEDSSDLVLESRSTSP